MNNCCHSVCLNKGKLFCCHLILRFFSPLQMFYTTVQPCLSENLWKESSCPHSGANRICEVNKTSQISDLQGDVACLFFPLEFCRFFYTEISRLKKKSLKKTALGTCSTNLLNFGQMFPRGEGGGGAVMLFGVTHTLFKNMAGFFQQLCLVLRFKNLRLYPDN